MGGFQRQQLLHIGTNVICFIATGVAFIVLLAKPQPALRRGFFCDDVSIRYPHNADTVSISVAFVTCAIPVLVLVIGFELVNGLVFASSGSESYTLQETATTTTTNTTTTTTNTTDTGDSTHAKPTDKARVKRALWRAGLLVACLIYANVLCFLVTEVFKLSFGRLRPFFLSVCQPDPDVTSWANCSGLYIEDIHCLNSDSEALIDSRKSFVSGHASFTAYNMLFICIYLQFRLPRSTPRLLVALLQGVAVGYLVFVCASRVYDHAHHPLDVFGGATLGILVAGFTVFKMFPSFVRSPPRKEARATCQETPMTPITKPSENKD